jgi:NADH-quinone oxidoreductase subunit H
MFFYKVDFFIESCIYSISYSLLAAVCVLVSVAYYTLLDRNVMASIQRRKGPNVVGFLGLFQPLSDGLKLLVKEEILPTSASHFLFLVAPVLTFLLSLLT